MIDFLLSHPLALVGVLVVVVPLVLWEVWSSIRRSYRGVILPPDFYETDPEQMARPGSEAEASRTPGQASRPQAERGAGGAGK